MRKNRRTDEKLSLRLGTLVPTQGFTQSLTRSLTSGVTSTAGFDPLSLNPIIAYEMHESMMAPLASESLDLDPANPSSLDIITATRAGTATYTDASGNIQTASANTVRVDHVDGVPMILVEPAATNLIDYSDLTPAGAWSSTGFNVTQNAILSPDGLNNGTKLEQTSTTRNINGAFISSSTGTSVTYSFWIKKGSGDTHLNSFLIRNNSRSPYNMKGSINLETGEIIVNEFGAGNLIVESYPNGWFKVKATRDTDISVGDDIRIYPPYTSSDGSNEIGQYNYTFGHQAEYGTVATSYIPTSGSAVTRAADNLVIDGSDFTNFYNQSEGTFYVEHRPNKEHGPERVFSFVGVSANELIYSTTSGALVIYTAGNYQGNSNVGDAVQGIVNLACYTFKTNSFKGALNGSLSTEDTQMTMPTLQALNIGSNHNTTDSFLNGHIKRLIYWPHHSDNL